MNLCGPYSAIMIINCDNRLLNYVDIKYRNELIERDIILHLTLIWDRVAKNYNFYTFFIYVFEVVLELSGKFEP